MFPKATASRAGEDSRTSCPTVLIIDDNPLNIKLLETIFKEKGLPTLRAENGPDGRKLAHEQSPDLILLDIMMPGESGFDTCVRLKLDPLTTNIPVIFVSAVAQPEERIKGFSLGAVDYVTKPFHPSELLARAMVHIKLKQAIDKAGDLTAPRQETEQRTRKSQESFSGTGVVGSQSRKGCDAPFNKPADDDAIAGDLPSRKITLKPGEHYVSKERVIIRTVLGSCVAACLWDESARVLGMNHFLLVNRPSGNTPSPTREEGGKYGTYAMEMLVDDMLKTGARLENLRAKVFGGAVILPSDQNDRLFCIGETNSRFAVNFLRKKRIPLVSGDLGGSSGRVILFSSEDFSVYVKTL